MAELLVQGAGPVGCAAALALQAQGRSVALRELPGARAPGAYRGIALSYASRLILERLGVWRALPARAIETIHVSQRASFGRVVLQAREAGVPALGYVVSYEALANALHAATLARGIERAAGEMPGARCVVHAEGRSADARERGYPHQALVARLRTDPGARATAYERFTEEGPIALLPSEGDEFALVWTCPAERAQALLGMPEPEFLAALGERLGRRPGTPVAVAERNVQPLALRLRASRVGPRAVYIGNAAQTLHPVAGQGFNLGLRDAWELALCLREADDPGAEAVLRRYAAQRALDVRATAGVTDWLARGFTGQAGRTTRGLALAALDALPAPRKFFTRRMMFGPSAWP